jgi:hypothetical protein
VVACVIKLGSDCISNTDCEAFLTKWGDWCRIHESAPLALLPVTSDYVENTLDRKSRAMIRKARQYYYYQVFNYNYHIEEIYRINTSIDRRQGKAMTAAYLTRPKAIARLDKLCGTKHRYVFIGGFDAEGKLKAYCALAIVGEIAILNTIIGHYDELTYGIMNGLIDYLVSYCYSTTGCRYLNYLDMINCTTGLRNFKSSVGFQSIKEEFEY